MYNGSVNSAFPRNSSRHARSTCFVLGFSSHFQHSLLHGWVALLRPRWDSGGHFIRAVQRAQLHTTLRQTTAPRDKQPRSQKRSEWRRTQKPTTTTTAAAEAAVVLRASPLQSFATTERAASTEENKNLQKSRVMRRLFTRQPRHVAGGPCRGSSPISTPLYASSVFRSFGMVSRLSCPPIEF